MITGALAFTTVAAFANTSPTTGRGIGSGVAEVRSCRALVASKLESVFSPAVAGFEQVDFASIYSAANCAGMAYRLTLVDSHRRSLVSATGRLDFRGVALADLRRDNVAAKDVAYLELVVSS